MSHNSTEVYPFCLSLPPNGMERHIPSHNEDDSLKIPERPHLCAGVAQRWIYVSPLLVYWSSCAADVLLGNGSHTPLVSDDDDELVVLPPVTSSQPIVRSVSHNAHLISLPNVRTAPRNALVMSLRTHITSKSTSSSTGPSRMWSTLPHSHIRNASNISKALSARQHSDHDWYAKKPRLTEDRSVRGVHNPSRISTLSSVHASPSSSQHHTSSSLLKNAGSLSISM
ncbi:hypothetical protein BJ138DRAFT_1118771 [Hygrophoropsis aurantiaca]|uniref:Uncharacterized protein n=1 Tax=Hygrophoropsis aurantiaca TaxID=72124 RepID=A0ACB7ZWF3_9AGAM|nr:hypothetical protein BJ138DRAFT_1118771 [Hygrophoropsis aurantiaca]